MDTITTQSRVAISGNTYPVKEQLKALGGTWNKAAGAWLVPAEKEAEAKSLVAAAGPSTYQPRESRKSRAFRRWQDNDRFSGYTRFSSGAEVYRNPRGRCEDAPCCGCCS